MNLLPQILIKGKSDSCTVQMLESGLILVGSISLNADEIELFGEALESAARLVTPQIHPPNMDDDTEKAAQ